MPVFPVLHSKIQIWRRCSKFLRRRASARLQLLEALWTAYLNTSFYSEHYTQSKHFTLSSLLKHIISQRTLQLKKTFLSAICKSFLWKDDRFKAEVRGGGEEDMRNSSPLYAHITALQKTLSQHTSQLPSRLLNANLLYTASAICSW